MSKNKLKKFADIAQMPNVFEFGLDKVLAGKFFENKGHWREIFFQNQNPIVLELGCGKGEYTLGLAQQCPEKNYIGIDIKGARIWTGAKESNILGLKNVAFLRTEIQALTAFFAENEIDEIWLTFPDPQMKKVRKRLLSVVFLDIYRHFLKNNSTIHLKTDSNFLFTYTKELVLANNLKINYLEPDIYSSALISQLPELQIKTYYESQWLVRGIDIKYIEFVLPQNVQLIEPQAEIPYDEYRSYGRQKRGELKL